jgi:hypothetical protein
MLEYIYGYLAIGSAINIPVFYLLYKRKLGKEAEDLLDQLLMIPPELQALALILSIMLWPMQVLGLLGLGPDDPKL